MRWQRNLGANDIGWSALQGQLSSFRQDILPNHRTRLLCTGIRDCAAYPTSLRHTGWRSPGFATTVATSSPNCGCGDWCSVLELIDGVKRVHGAEFEVRILATKNSVNGRKQRSLAPPRDLAACDAARSGAPCAEAEHLRVRAPQSESSAASPATTNCHQTEGGPSSQSTILFTKA